MPVVSVTPASNVSRRSAAILATLALLYTAQGIPFGFASEYLPVVLREAGYSRTAISAVFWLQLPWQLKLFWARAADHPRVRPRARAALLALQLALAGAVALYAPFDIARDAAAWFAVTALCALLAATQDIFVDALAVRALAPEDRGFGNVAQVAGYRLGILAGGAGLLLAAARFGQAPTLLACAAIIAAAGLGAFALRDEMGASPRVEQGPFRTGAPEPAAKPAAPFTVGGVLRHVTSRAAWPVLALAATFKLGPHLAGVLIKPMAVDAHWTRAQIGWAVVTVGTAAGFAGAGAGGVLYRALRERRALAVAAVAQGVACLPLLAAAAARVPVGLTTFAIALEHFASGLGTTVLFAALMSATRPSSAGLHYTVLTSANALALGLGGILGGLAGDVFGEKVTFALAAAVSLAPLPLVMKWDASAEASSREPDPTG